MTAKKKPVAREQRSRAALPADIQDAFRHAAERRECKLKTVQREAVEAFLRQRSTLLIGGASPTYLAASRTHRPLQVILPAALTREATKAAMQDGVPLSTLLHTALTAHHETVLRLAAVEGGKG